MVYKRLKSYVDILEEITLRKSEIDENQCEILVKNISYNSKDVSPQSIFICKGENFKDEYLTEAIGKGAICYISTKYMTDKIPYIVVSDIREALNLVSSHMYDHIWNERLTEIGITGTKGKSTTTYLLKSILDCAGKGKTAVISGICNYNGKSLEKANLTTPETLELHKLLSESVDNGCETLVMEVSSQGLKYKRVEDIKYKIGVFLNIGMDHISENEHKSFEDYFHSKLELFKHCEIACINTDIEEKYLYKIMDAAAVNGCKIVTFGTSQNAHYRGYLVKDDIDGLTFELMYSGLITTMKTSIGGGYNLTNALAAIAVARQLHISLDDIEEGLLNANIPGRMEVFSVPNKDAKIIVDYAHNSMSYDALFDSVDKYYPNYKKIFMFGCAADRAFNRRKEAGTIAQREADKVIITKYGDGKESFDQIAEEICRYISPYKDINMIYDRESAIKKCIDEVENGWIIVMTGCETDSDIVRTYLNN